MVEILEASLSLDTRELWTNLERPQSGDRMDGQAMTIAGWVVGRRKVAIAVELVIGGAVLRRVPVNQLRPDLAVALPKIKEAEHCGFRAEVVVPGPAEVEVRV